jgi:hypothetical protein
MAKNGLLLNKHYLYALILGGFLLILTVGLLSGLIGRPSNCKEYEQVSTNTLTTPSSTQISDRPSKHSYISEILL